MNKELDSKQKKKELINEAAERLAEILYQQIEYNRKNKRKKIYGKK